MEILNKMPGKNKDDETILTSSYWALGSVYAMLYGKFDRRHDLSHQEEDRIKRDEFYEKMIRRWEKVLELDPGHKDVKYNLSKLRKITTSK